MTQQIKVTPAVAEYNRLNKNHDYSYMFSDDGRVWRRGEEESKELNQLYSQLTAQEKDLVGLYNNHILRRGSEQFSKPVIKLPNTLEEARKYYQEINPRN